MLAYCPTCSNMLLGEAMVKAHYSDSFGAAFHAAGHTTNMHLLPLPCCCCC